MPLSARLHHFSYNVFLNNIIDETRVKITYSQNSFYISIKDYEDAITSQIEVYYLLMTEFYKIKLRTSTSLCQQSFKFSLSRCLPQHWNCCGTSHWHILSFKLPSFTSCFLAITYIRLVSGITLVEVIKCIIRDYREVRLLVLRRE